MDKRKLGFLALWWGWIPAVWFIWRGIVKLFFGGYTWGQQMDQWLLANVLSGGWWLWLWITVGFIGSVAILAMYIDDNRGYYLDERISLTKSGLGSFLAIVMLIASVMGVIQTTKIGWDNDKDEARYYNRATTFVISDLGDSPLSVKYLMQDATESSRNGCDMVDGSDMSTCIKKGDLSPEGWEPRVGSLDGAIFAIKRTSGDRQRISLNERW